MDKKLIDLVGIILRDSGIPRSAVLTNQGIDEYVKQVREHPRFHEFGDPLAEKTIRVDSPHYERKFLDFCIAYPLAIDMYKERDMGGPYFRHLWDVAYDLADIGWDPITVSVGIIHDAVEHRSKEIEKELVSPDDGALVELKKGLCDNVMSHVKSAVPNLPPETIEDITRILFGISKVPKEHNLLYLESIEPAKARAIKFSDGGQNIIDLAPYPVRQGYFRLSRMSKQYSFAEKVRRLYKTLENIHTGKLYLMKHRGELFTSDGERLLEGFYRLVSLTIKSALEIEADMRKRLNIDEVIVWEKALADYRERDFYSRVTFDVREDDSRFCGRLLHYFGREYKTEAEKRILDEGLNNSRLFGDCVIAKDIITHLYMPQGRSIIDIRDSVLDGRYIEGLTYSNMREVSRELARRIVTK